MTGRRRYDEGCAAAHALDLVGERWALLVVRELILGPKRFTDLRTGIPGASSTVLAQRLRELEDVGVVARRTLPPPAAVKVYELTEWGAELEPVISALGRWGARSPLMRHDAPLSVDAFMLALRTMFDPAATGGRSARIDLRLDRDRFVLTVADGAITVERGESADPDAVVTTDPDTLNALVFDGADLTGAVASGAARIDGDRTAVADLLTWFPLPKPAG